MAKRPLQIPPSIPKIDWYVVKENQQRGPLTIEAILEEFKKGTIQLHYQVKNSKLSDVSWTVIDLIHSISDPAYLLMDTLQAAKKKNSYPVQRSLSTPLRSSPPFFSVKRIIVFCSGLGLVALISWGVSFLFNSPPPVEIDSNPSAPSPLHPNSPTMENRLPEIRPPADQPIPPQAQSPQDAPKPLADMYKPDPGPTPDETEVPPVDTRQQEPEPERPLDPPPESQQ